MSTEFMAARTAKDGRALLKPVVVRQKAQHPETDGSVLVANLIEAAKKMQIRKLRRTIVDIKNQSSKPADRAPGVMSPALGLGNVSALESRPVKAPPVQPSINGTDDKGRTALHFSCGMVSTECAIVLLESGADVNVRDNEGFTPLHMAAGYGRSQSVELLLKAGANPFVKDKVGRTPRELAVEIRDTGMRHDGSSVPRGDMEATITLLGSAEWKEHQVAKERQHNAIGSSVESVAGVSADDGAKRPAAVSPLDELLAAAQAGDSEGVAKALAKLEAKSDVTWIAGRAASLANALSAACRNGHVEIAEMLLKYGASVDAVDVEGATPLLAAADSGFANCVQLLLKAGAQPDARDKVGVTPLIAAAYNGHDEALSALVHHGAAVDARSHGGVTPLIAAAEGRHARCIHLLIEAGADVNARTTEGKTALMHAVGRNSVEATEALLGGGADVNAVDSEGFSALHHGARLDAADCVQLLCAKGASMTKRCKKGRTALMEAPKASASSAILEEKWAALEEEVARRQAEILELFADDSTDNASKSLALAAAGAKSRDKKKAAKGRRTPKGIASLTTKLQGLAGGAGSAGSAGFVGDEKTLGTPVKTPESSSRPSMSPVSSVMDFGQTTDSSGMSTAEDEEGADGVEVEEEGIEYDTQDIFEIMAAASRRSLSGGGSGSAGGGVLGGAGSAGGDDGFIPVGSGEKAPNRVSEVTGWLSGGSYSRKAGGETLDAPVPVRREPARATHKKSPPAAQSLTQQQPQQQQQQQPKNKTSLAKSINASVAAVPQSQPQQAQQKLAPASSSSSAAAAAAAAHAGASPWIRALVGGQAAPAPRSISPTNAVSATTNPSSKSAATPSAVQSGGKGCTCKQSQQCEEDKGNLARRVEHLEAELRAARAAADEARAAAAAERARAAQLEQRLLSERKAADLISAQSKSQIQVLQPSC
ncbi:hypothetical protein CLOP_g21955 [Closterium sp. NIES-67]|nr:hypothetical protein CLOP_g21955 [Closterium sp. NIES-67]